MQQCFTLLWNVLLNRISRTERSGRYGSDQSRDESEWRDRRDRDQERDHNMRRWGEERRSDRYEGDRRGSRDSPEVFISIFSDFSCILMFEYKYRCLVTSTLNWYTDSFDLSKESGKDVIVIDQKMVITLMAITQSRITDGNLERRRRARRSCSGVCLLMSLRKM